MDISLFDPEQLVLPFGEGTQQGGTVKNCTNNLVNRNVNQNQA